MRGAATDLCGQLDILSQDVLEMRELLLKLCRDLPRQPLLLDLKLQLLLPPPKTADVSQPFSPN